MAKPRNVKIAWQDINSPILKKKSFFYSSLRPIAVLCKIFGLFPIQNATKNAKDLHYNWFSLDTFSSLFTIPMLGYLYATYLAPELKLGHIFNSKLLYLSLLSLFLISRSNVLVTLIQEIEHFDVQFQNLPVFEHRDKPNLQTRRCIIITLFYIVSETVFLGILNYFDRCNNCMLQAVMIIVQKLPIYIHTMLYYFICKELIIRFIMFEKSLKHFINLCDIDRKYSLNDPFDVEKYRLNHVQLTNCVRLLDQVFGFRLSIIFTLCGLELLSSLFTLIYMDYALEYYEMFSALVFMILTYNIIAITDNLGETNVPILECLLEIPSSILEEESSFQIGHFISQMKMNSAKVTASGLVVINNAFLASFFNLFTTYLIAAIQLAPQIKEIHSYMTYTLIGQNESCVPTA